VQHGGGFGLSLFLSLYREVRQRVGHAALLAEVRVQRQTLLEELDRVDEVALARRQQARACQSFWRVPPHQPPAHATASRPVVDVPR